MKRDTKAIHSTAVRGEEAPSANGRVAKMKLKEYERELRGLHGELAALQEWVKATGAKICVAFEGRDTAGKGGTIKAITERVSPRVFRVVALPAPTATDTPWAAWFVAHNNDKRRDRLNIITPLLGQVDYEPLERPNITLPKRQKPGDHTEPTTRLRVIPTPF